MSTRQPKPTPQQTLERIRATLDYQRVAGVALAFIGLGALFYHWVERLNWLDAFYFTTMTLATVGYGDIVPHTPAGKLFTMVYVLLGISIFVVLARIVLGGLLVRGRTRRHR